MRIQHEKKNCDRLARLGKLMTVFGVLFFIFLGFSWWKFVTAEKEHLVLYFTQNINGLNIGSPVKVMGIVVGEVELLDIQAPKDGNDEFYAVVRVVLNARALQEKGLPAQMSDLQVLAAEVESGLRGELALGSPMTGEYYIELNYLPKAPARFATKPEDKIAEIPVLQSEFSKTTESVAARVERFSKIDFKAATLAINEVLDEMLVSTRPEAIAEMNKDVLERLGKAQVLLNKPSLVQEFHSLNENLDRLQKIMADEKGAIDERLKAGTDVLRSIQQSLAQVSNQAVELGVLLDFKSNGFQKVKTQLRKLQHFVRGWTNFAILPVHLALPRGVNRTGLSPAGQSEEYYNEE